MLCPHLLRGDLALRSSPKSRQRPSLSLLSKQACWGKRLPAELRGWAVIWGTGGRGGLPSLTWNPLPRSPLPAPQSGSFIKGPPAPAHLLQRPRSLRRGPVPGGDEEAH